MFSVLFVSLASVALAQSVVKGTIKDEAGSPMPGVNVIIKGTTIGSTTDATGQYSIEIPAGSEDAALIVSFIGYLSEEQTIGGRTVIDVNLTPSIETLNEIVVVGYGTQKKSDVTGSLVSVNAEALREVPAANIQQALQGRMAGVEVQRIGTAPGGGARIRVRGERSILGSNDPLIVLDGIPYEGNISDINQDEIASVDVLKDASATAIYGSRGANGVIIITTKRGKAGDTRLTYDGYVGLTTVARKYKMYNAEEYAEMRDRSTYGQGYMPGEVESMALGRSTDWQDLMYEDGYITNHNIGVQGGTEKNQFSLGAGYFKETTVLPGQDFERFSLRATIDTKIGEKFKIGINSLNSVNIANGTQFVNQQPNTPGAYGGSMMFDFLTLSPLMPAYNANGELNQRPGGNPDDEFRRYNPLLLKNNQNNFEDRVRRLRTFNSLFAEYQFTPALKYRLNVGLDYRQANLAQFQGKDSYYRPNNAAARASVYNEEGYGYTLEHLLIYEKTFKEKHRVSFTGLFSVQEDHTYNTRVSRDSITADFLQYYDLSVASAGSNAVPNGGESSWGLLSYMARVNYAYDDRFLLTLTGRRDGSSRLADKWHQYPAVAVGWNVVNEAFMQDLTVVTNLKLRAGWGETSNQAVNPYTTLGGVGNTIGTSGGNVPVKYNYGSQKVSGYFPATIPDKTLSWEFTRTLNIGIDIGLVKERITATIDWYKATTSDVLFNQNLPITSAYVNAFQTNIGTIENKGLEVALTTVNVRSADGFNWTTDFNWYYNRNKLVKLNDGFVRNIANGLHLGEPLTAIYDYDKLGIWQADEEAEALAFGQVPGQLKIRDIAGGTDGGPDGIINTDDRTIIGSQQAKWQGGMTNRIAYKGFDFSFVTFMRYGGTLISGLHQNNSAYVTQNNGIVNGLKVDYWTPENPTNWFPAQNAQLYYPGAPSVTPTPPQAATAWTTTGYYDATFIKIRSINLGYKLPENLVSRIGAKAVRVYVTAQNPFLLYSPYVTKYNGVDPEATGQGATGFVGGGPGNFRTQGNNPALVIALSTPPTRSYIVGLNITF
jgi:TonB-linked SusC/RagA family outer membrane protein